jgi:hypothetical protein
MLKPQDCLLLIKLLANPDKEWSQRRLSEELLISLSEVNAGIKRLLEAGLLRKNEQAQFVPIVAAAEEFLINGLKYVFPGKLGEYTRGTPTSVSAPVFENEISLGSEAIPVWPDAHGIEKGVALMPIYPSVSKALRENPDQRFYDLLALIDAIRSGGARERNIAIKLLKERIKHVQ